MSDYFGTPWPVACQAPLSMGFPRQEYWSGLPFPPPGDLPDPGITSWTQQQDGGERGHDVRMCSSETIQPEQQREQRLEGRGDGASGPTD